MMEESNVETTGAFSLPISLMAFQTSSSENSLRRSQASSSEIESIDEPFEEQSPWMILLVKLFVEVNNDLFH